MRWRIYYGDGTTFGDEQGSPWEAPRQNVQIIVQADDRVGWMWCSGGDYFYYDDSTGGWHTTDSIWDHLIVCKQPLVLFGRQLSDAQWMDLFMRVKAELGEKQGWLVTEDQRGVKNIIYRPDK